MGIFVCFRVFGGKRRLTIPQKVLVGFG
jgi:hypothetical protein